MAVQGYVLGIMAVCLAAALGIWLALVFLADKRGSSRPQENSPHREVVGGTFEAWRGGRQVMPDPTESLAHEPGEFAGEARVPEQRKKREAEQVAGPRDRR